MKRLSYFFAFFFPLVLNAQTFIQNGVYYSIIFGTDNIGVTSSNSTSFYKGDIVIPETVEYDNKTYTVVSIDDGAFTGSEGLTSVTLPQTITTIGDRSFSGCLGLTNFVIPGNVTSIGYDAFYGSKNIKEITIPKSVTIICSRAFSGLEKLVLEDGEEPLKLVTLYNINDNTPFHICPLESVYLGRNLEYTSEYSPFRDNSKLMSLIIGEGVTEIGSYLFKDCTGLKELTLSSSLKNINRYAFWGCTGLLEITIPATLDHLGMNVFYETNIKKVVIEDGSRPISFDSFLHSPFTSCPVENIYLGRNVTCNMFATECPFSKSKEVTIGNEVTTINDNLFKKCEGLSKVVIGANVNTIGSNAFGNCIDLNNVLCNVINVPTTSTDAFNGSSINEATLSVPKESIEQYRTIKPWSDFGKIVSLDGESAIRTIRYEDKSNEYYSPNGQTFTIPSRGIVIVKSSNGMTKKTIMK